MAIKTADAEEKQAIVNEVCEEEDEETLGALMGR